MSTQLLCSANGAFHKAVDFQTPVDLKDPVGWTMAIGEHVFKPLASLDRVMP